VDAHVCLVPNLGVEWGTSKTLKMNPDDKLLQVDTITFLETLLIVNLQHGGLPTSFSSFFF